MAVKITKRMLEKAEIAVSNFLDERAPAAALPGGVQLFADPGDHLDPEFKHEKGCNDLACAVLTAALTRSNAKKP
jgi:hypothetical protein